MTAEQEGPKPRRRTKKQAQPMEDNATVSREDYALFIGQIELENIWLATVHIENTHGPKTPDHATFHFSSTARQEPLVGGFRAFHHYTVRIEAVDSLLAELQVTFGVDFASTLPLTDEVFSIFEEVNLPVNTWPYLREFVSTTIGRIGWLPFTIPALKQGVKNAKRPTTSTRMQGPKAQRTAE